MLRKFAILTVTLITLAGLSFAADDEETPTTKIMEQIQNKTNALRKATRTKADYAKSTKAITKDTEDVVKLAKEAREIKEPAEKDKKPLADLPEVHGRDDQVGRGSLRRRRQGRLDPDPGQGSLPDLHQDLHRLPRGLQEGRVSIEPRAIPEPSRSATVARLASPPMRSRTPSTCRPSIARSRMTVATASGRGRTPSASWVRLTWNFWTKMLKFCLIVPTIWPSTSM